MKLVVCVELRVEVKVEEIDVVRLDVLVIVRVDVGVVIWQLLNVPSR